MSDTPKVGIVLVSHSAALAEGTAELAGQIAGGTVTIATAGGTEDVSGPASTRSSTRSGSPMAASAW
jgi:dihydroxyacetone kinase DhaKLM complex PTS-EIIA-like component DhaM